MKTQLWIWLKQHQSLNIDPVTTKTMTSVNPVTYAHLKMESESEVTPLDGAHQLISFSSSYSVST